MKLESQHIESIRNAFAKMLTKEDLLCLLNDTNVLLYGDKATPVTMKQLIWCTNPKLAGERYRQFFIKKKSGGERSIHAPVKRLKSIQRTLSIILQCVFEPHKAAMGFIWNRSIVDNARIHIGSRYVYNTDLKDFFPSIDQARVWKCLQLKPFDLSQDSKVEPDYMKWEDFLAEMPEGWEYIPSMSARNMKYISTPNGLITIFAAKNWDPEQQTFIMLAGKSLKTKGGTPLAGTVWLVNKVPNAKRLEIANIVASICCTELSVERLNESGGWINVRRNVLPQGAPTSPVLTNVVCQRLDFLLSGVAKRFGLKYSRYADDITFSSMHNVYDFEGEFLQELNRIIIDQGFHIKESKTRLQKDGHRQEVTGLLVNEKVNVQKRYIKQLRMWLYYWERYGYERSYGFFLQQYLADKGHVKKGKPNMINVISGKLDYLKMVNGVDNEMCLKLRKRLDALITTDDKKISILDIWENFGIEKAIEKYYE
jgi:retron-type reverse transcriptase